MPVAALPLMVGCSPKLVKESGEGKELHLSFQEGVAPGGSLEEKLDFMEQLGVTGFEPGGENLSRRVEEMLAALKGRSVRVSAICAGFEGFILSTEESVRRRCIDTLKEILVAAGQLGAKGVIIVPAFHSQTPVLPHTTETRQFLCEHLSLLADFARRHQTTVILEPLNRKEAFYLRQLGDAASICRDVNNPGLRCMGDFWHMTAEETSDAGAFLSAGKYLHHVHIASRLRRSMPGEDGAADNYLKGFHALKEMDYDGYISFECGCRSDDRRQATTNAVALIREQWEMA